MNPTGPSQTKPGLQSPASQNNPGGEIRDRLQPITPERQTEGGRVADDAAPFDPDADFVGSDVDEAESRPESSGVGYTDSASVKMIDDDDGCFLEPSCD